MLGTRLLLGVAGAEVEDARGAEAPVGARGGRGGGAVDSGMNKLDFLASHFKASAKSARRLFLRRASSCAGVGGRGSAPRDASNLLSHPCLQLQSGQAKSSRS